jgi:hypothetical protein
MRRISRCATGAIVLVALVLAWASMSGCALVGNESLYQWRPVASGHLSGERPNTLDLGVHELSERSRVEWTASGAPSVKVRVTIRLDGETHGYGHSETLIPGKHGGKGIARFTIDEPGMYRITFTQRFPTKEGPGYGFDVTASTLR